MPNFEMYLKNKSKLSRIWIRYVDDIFDVVSNNKIDNTLKMLNETVYIYKIYG